MLIRAVQEGDAEALLWLLKRLDDETRFMMYEPGERVTTVREQEESLRTILSGGNGTVLLAEEAGRPSVSSRRPGAPSGGAERSTTKGTKDPRQSSEKAVEPKVAKLHLPKLG